MNLVLESQRLLLRPLADTDLDIELALLSDSAVMRYVSGPFTADDVTGWLPIAVRRGGGGCIGFWCVIDRSTDEKLGHALLLPMPVDEPHPDWDLASGDELPDCEIEIGYLLKPSAWGKGYATEACKRLVKFAFEETPLTEIVAVTHPENTASKNVLRKSGAIEEGMRRAYAAQCQGFRISRQQWRETNQKAG